jgi:endonuclease/exonuclease/phosphatase family metal-dependent hydrolase
MEVIRVFFTPVYRFVEETRIRTAIVVTVLVFLAPFLTPLITKLLGRFSLTAALSALAVVRIVLQLERGSPLALAAAAVVLALVAWTLLLVKESGEGAAGRMRFLLGLVVGLFLDTGIRGAFSTWDTVWHSGAIPLAVTVALSGGLAVAGWRVSAVPDAAQSERMRTPILPIVALGPWLMLQMLFFQNVAYVASSGDLDLHWAAAIILAGGVVAVAIVALRPSPSTLLALGGGAAVVALAGQLKSVTGAPAVFLVLGGQALSTGLLSVAVGHQDIAARGGQAYVRRMAASFGLASVLFIGLVTAYQFHYEAPLPFSNGWLPAGAGLLLAVGAFRSTRGGGRVRPSRRSVIVAVVLLGGLAAAVPVGLWATSPTPRVVQPTEATFRLVDYNIHLGIGLDGRLDPERIAEVIEAQHPDVVVLHEVARGWVISGTLDLGHWLARRLQMRLVWSPAADHQFGNLLLSRLPLLDAATVSLPQGTGPTARSYVRADLRLGEGRSLTLIGTHLQKGIDNQPTRIREIEKLLTGWNQARPTIIVGDMNARPGTPEIKLLLQAGFHSPEKAAACPVPTSPTGTCTDWVFGTPDVGLHDLRVVRTIASDHAALAVSVTLAKPQRG